MATTGRDDFVSATLAQRRIVAAAKERKALADEYDLQEALALQKREAHEQRSEAAAAEWAAKSGAAITVEFMGRRISIRMNHRDALLRDAARNAAHMLAQHINRLITSGLVTATNTGRSDFATDPLWLEKLLNLDLRYAHERGLVTITNLKGKPARLKKMVPSKATVNPMPDAWLAEKR